LDDDRRKQREQLQNQWLEEAKQVYEKEKVEQSHKKQARDAHKFDPAAPRKAAYKGLCSDRRRDDVCISLMDPVIDRSSIRVCMRLSVIMCNP